MKTWMSYIALMMIWLAAAAQKDTVEFYLVGSIGEDVGMDMVKSNDSTFLLLVNSGIDSFQQNSNPHVVEITDRGLVLRAMSIGTYGTERGNHLVLLGDTMVVIAGISNAPTAAYQGFAWGIGLEGEKYFERYFTIGEDWSEVSGMLAQGNVLYIFLETLSSDSKKIDLIELSLPTGTQSSRKSLAGTEGYRLESVKRSMEGGFIGCGSVLGANDSLEGFLIKWDEDFNPAWTTMFSKPGNDGYNDVDQLFDSNYVVVGFSDSYFEEDEDIVIHKYDTAGQLLLEAIHGYDITANNNNDRGLGVSVKSGDTIFLTGFTETYGEGEKEVFMSKLDTAFQTLFGSTTMGTPGTETSCRILPHKNGVVGIGYSNYQTSGLGDALFWVRREIQYAETEVEEVLLNYDLTDTITKVEEVATVPDFRLLVDHVLNTVRIGRAEAAGVFYVQVFNMDGALVYSNPFYFSNSAIPLNPGNYIIRAGSGDLIRTFKIILF